MTRILPASLARARARTQDAVAASRNQPPVKKDAAVQTVELPDISRAAAPVQAQLREQYASLQRQAGDPDSPPAALASAYGAMGRLFMATEFLDQAERSFGNAQALEPNEMRWPYYLGHVARMKNEPARAAALFERTLALQADHVPSLVWLAEMRLVEGHADAAEPLLTKALAARAARGRRPLQAGPREARSPGLCGRREESRSRAGTTARLVEHSLPAGARLPRPRRHEACRSPDAASRQRGRASGRSADAAGRWASAERRRSRSPRRRGPGETSVGRSRHVSTPGDPGGAGQRVHAAQSRHGAVRVRRRRRRPRSVSGRRQAVTRSGQGPLRRRHRHGGGGPRPRSHRGVLGFRQKRSGRARSAA